MTNAYIIYIHCCARDKLRPHEVHNHREFLELVAEGLIFEETIGMTGDTNAPSPCKPGSKKNRKRKETRAVAKVAKRQRGPNASVTLSADSVRDFTTRRANLGMHELVPNADSKVGDNHRCAVCNYGGKLPGSELHKEERIRKSSQVRCGHCAIYMCLPCWSIWHS